MTGLDPRTDEAVTGAINGDDDIDRLGSAAGPAGDHHPLSSERGQGGSDPIDVIHTSQGPASQQRRFSQIGGHDGCQRKQALTVRTLDIRPHESIAPPIDQHRVDDRCRKDAGHDTVGNQTNDLR